ncbi:MATE efflux family protein [Actinidia rufa]|uniref:MATE efflux family protein n=1 Tax=Actinidia rufa TaxID=165716 RepID=A0A7J0HC65_9ERIC|nr:MATE efflux family protein [Actinidia rufa]
MAAKDTETIPPENKRRIPRCIFFKDARLVFKMDELGKEIASIALPAAMALTADPIASLVDTAFIGQIGPVELAAVGVSIAVFNQVSRIAIFPLVNSPPDSVESTYKSESISRSFEIVRSGRVKRHIPSSSALIIGSILGLVQAIFLIFGAKPILNVMGVKSDSPMLRPAQRYLVLRSLGAPAVLLSLAMQGVFRGFKDTKTPLYATGFLLLMRVVAVTFCVTLAASLAARQGPTSMAAFQAILASAFAKKDNDHATATASRVLQLGLVLGLALAIILGVGLQFGARLFTKDVNVLHLITTGIPFVAATQPINALAFVLDGVNFGGSDFAYTAYSMIMVSVVSIVLLFIFSSAHGFIGIWVALTIYMSLRAVAGFWRIGTGTGPWGFLRS